MTDLADFPFATPGVEERPALAKPRRCLHPRAARRMLEDGGTACVRCGANIDATASRRGRNNRARGNAIERELARKLGLRRVGQYGGPDDLRGEMFSVQVKSGGSFPERFWRWLQAVPASADQTALLVVTDAPGPGHRRRALVVIDLEAWAQLHGVTEPDPHPHGGTDALGCPICAELAALRRVGP